MQVFNNVGKRGSTVLASHLIVPLGDFVSSLFQLKLQLFDFFDEIVLELESAVSFAGFFGDLAGESVDLGFQGQVPTAPGALDVRQMQMGCFEALFEQFSLLQQGAELVIGGPGCERCATFL